MSARFSFLDKSVSHLAHISGLPPLDMAVNNRQKQSFQDKCISKEKLEGQHVLSPKWKRLPCSRQSRGVPPRRGSLDKRELRAGDLRCWPGGATPPRPTRSWQRPRGSAERLPLSGAPQCLHFPRLRLPSSRSAPPPGQGGGRRGPGGEDVGGARSRPRPHGGGDTVMICQMPQVAPEP